MKKMLGLSAIALLTCQVATAQVVDRNALGIRAGGGASYGAEISYQIGTSRSNRVEIDLGFGGNSNYNRFGVAGIYQWVWPIGVQGFNWYAGPGGGLSFNNAKDNKNDHDDYAGVAIGGQIGLGFNFPIPLQMTLDTRPFWDISSGNSDFSWGFAIGFRYRF